MIENCCNGSTYNSNSVSTATGTVGSGRGVDFTDSFEPRLELLLRLISWTFSVISVSGSVALSPINTSNPLSDVTPSHVPPTEIIFSAKHPASSK